MAWEKAAEATVITQEAAHLAMVRMLEAVADIESRCRIRNLLAMECEFIETESTEGGRGADVLLLGGRPVGALAGLSDASPASRRSQSRRIARLAGPRCRAPGPGHREVGRGQPHDDRRGVPPAICTAVRLRD